MTNPDKLNGLTPEQAEVRDYVGGNILVSASAGSGKTHTMTERIVKLVCENNVSVNKILAVTFTETAAADMREKLRNALIKKIDGVSESDKALSNRLAHELKELPTADISTLHSFCGRLIRSYFFAAGVSPDFKILDQGDAYIIRAEAVDKTFREFYEQDGFFDTLADRHARGRSDENFKELVLSVYDYADSEANPEILLSKFENLYSEQGMKSLLSELKSHYDKKVARLVVATETAYAELSADGLVKGAEFAETLAKDMRAALSSADVYALKKDYSDYKLKLNFERKLIDRQKNLKDAVSEARKEFADLSRKLSASVGVDFADDLKKASDCREHTAELVKVIGRFSEIYAQSKRDENALDFNDLEHFALKILSDDSIRRVVKQKYEYVFVDEYQDTNGVQDEIVSAIGNFNVLTVGDVKQSIYGFRGCRADFFGDKDKTMTDNGEKVVRLNKNFRSAKKVIEAVNAIFDFCMTEEIYGENYKGKSELVFGGLYPDDADGRAELHFLKREPKAEKDFEKPRVYDLLEECKETDDGETAVTAALVKKIIDDELSNTYYDVSEKKYKPVTYGDIAVLTRAKSNKFVRDLVNELVIKYGLPVTSATDENVCDYPEIKILINALKAVDCFKWDLPLVSTLKSPIGGFTEEDLFEMAQFYLENIGKNNSPFYSVYSYYIENADTALSVRLKEFDDYFNGVRFISDFVGARGVLEKLISDKNLRAYFYAEKNGVEKADRLNRFLSATVVGGKIFTVKEFLNRIENSPESFSLARSGGENTVKAMTIHASKGLEYPVVIVCGLENGFSVREDSEEILLSREYGIAVKHYDDETRTVSDTLLRGAIRARLQEERVKEEMRLFYVATTRAKYSLHLVFTAKNDYRKETFFGADDFVGFIPAYMPVTEHSSDELDFSVAKDKTVTVMIGETDSAAVEEMRRNYAYTYPYIADVSLPIKSSVTAANSSERQEYYPVEELFPETETVTNTALGIVAHKILELYDFNRRNDFDGEIKRMLAAGYITESEKEGLNLDRIAAAIRGKTFDGVVGKEIFREKSFLTNVPAKLIFDTDSEEQVLVQGVIDLLVIDGDSASVIDYKYSSLSDARLKERYGKQLNLYAYAVERALGLKVKNKTVLSLLTGNAVKID